MNFFVFLLCCVVCLAAPSGGESACSFTDPCPLKGGELLKQPTQLVSSDGRLEVDLNVDVTDFKVDWLTLQRRTYNGEVPAPTWRVKRGDVIWLNLINNLQEPEKTSPHNSPRYPNSTNMHTHGLHISPEIPEDHVLLHVSPGDSRFYVYNIEENHPSGSFWYHPHLHGSTVFQVHSGMAGMIIVEDDPNDPTVSDIINAISCPQNCDHDLQLVFQPTLLYSGSNQFTSIQEGIEDKVQNLDQYIVSSTGGTFKDWIKDPANGVDYFTTNGQLEPVVHIGMWDWHRFRMVNAGGGPNLEVELVDSEGERACDVLEISIDGVYLNTTRRPRLGKSLMVASARVDWMVACFKPGTYVLRSKPSDIDIMSVGSISRYTGTLLTVKVFLYIPRPVYFNSNLPKRPSYVSNFLEATQDDVHGRFAIELSPILALNREQFPETLTYRYQITVGELQEWYLINTSPTKSHPMHIHVNHFQVVEYNPYTGPVGASGDRNRFKFFTQESKTCYFQHEGYDSSDNIPMPEDALKYLGHDKRWEEGGPGTLGYAQRGEFRDVLLVPPLSNITIRFMAHKFTGGVVIHCHLLNHEDRGMMFVVGIAKPGETLHPVVPSGNAYPGTCKKCDPFPFNTDMSNCTEPVYNRPCNPELDPEGCGAFAVTANKDQEKLKFSAEQEDFNDRKGISIFERLKRNTNNK